MTRRWIEVDLEHSVRFFSFPARCGEVYQRAPSGLLAGGCRSCYDQDDAVAAVVQSVRKSICNGKSTLAHMLRVVVVVLVVPEQFFFVFGLSSP